MSCSRLLLAALCAVAFGTACTAGAPSPAPSAAPSPTAPDEVATSPSAASSTTADPAPSATAAPGWLGTRVLEPGPTGFPPPQPTPASLFPRSIVTEDRLPPPADATFHASVSRVDAEVARRSTWRPGCPVALADLRHVIVTHWGFDGAHHTGELLLHEDAVDPVVTIFRTMHRERFPLEQVTITTPADLAAPPTGDGNVTSAFVCRDTRGSGAWSAHAYGRALDVNPFHNPYDRMDDDGRVVLPELATAYTDRSLDLPGMLTADHPVVAAIERAGWHWGGAYTSLSDPMHLSATGR